MRTTFVLAVALTASAAAELRKDIEYAKPNGISQLLDVSIPEGKGPFPIAIIVHGGGWEAGDKAVEWVQPLFKPLNDAGFVWFSINYRLSPQAPYPAMLEDVFAAVRWVKAHAAEYKGDPRRVALIGESAGGHLVALVGTRGRGDAKVQAVVDFYGPHDFLARARELDHGDYTGMAKRLWRTAPPPDVEQKLKEASPVDSVYKDMPPFLFIHGTADKAVPVNQSPMMCDKMKAAGASCEVILIEGAPHGMSNWEKNPAFQTYKPRMIDWLTKTLR